LFFVITGYKFRPAVDNPYLPVDTAEGDEDAEFGMGESQSASPSHAEDLRSTSKDAELEMVAPPPGRL